MDFKYSKLRGRIVEKYGTQGRFAKAVGQSEISISRKMTGQTEFSKEDMKKWCNLLDIEYSEVGEYFFYPDSLKV